MTTSTILALATLAVIVAGTTVLLCSAHTPQAEDRTAATGSPR